MILIPYSHLRQYLVVKRMLGAYKKISHGIDILFEVKRESGVLLFPSWKQ
jgi:hypothetical protein